MAHAVVLNVKSHEQANYYKDKLETLLKKHEGKSFYLDNSTQFLFTNLISLAIHYIELKKKSAKELSAMKVKHNEEFLKMKTELEEAR